MIISWEKRLKVKVNDKSGVIPYIIELSRSAGLGVIGPVLLATPSIEGHWVSAALVMQQQKKEKREGIVICTNQKRGAFILHRWKSK